MGPMAVSRPELVHNVDASYDDAIHADGSASQESQLLRAASQNNVDTIHQLLSKSESLLNVNHADPTGQTALHLAADKGCLEAVQVMVKDYGANVAATDQDGIGILQAAVIAGHANITKFLLNRNADPDQADLDGDTPRSCAQDSDDPDMIALFANVPPKEEDDNQNNRL